MSYPSPLPKHSSDAVITLVHGRRDGPADAQGLVLSERLAEVPQHGQAQALAAMAPPDKHGV